MMMTRFGFLRAAVIVTSASICLGVGHSATSSDVQILVDGVHFGGRVIYRYRIRNDSGASISRVELGVGEPGKELPAVPWIASMAVTDTAVPVPIDQCKPFSNMTCAIALFQFDSMSEPKSIAVMQDAESDSVPGPSGYSNGALIRSGTVSSAAEIKVPSRVPGYLSAWGTAFFLDHFPVGADGQPILRQSVPFTRSDLVPPSISGSAVVSKDRGMLSAGVQLVVKDDVDPGPEVALVSVTANEPLKTQDVSAAIGTDARTVRLKPNKGRIYYLTYRATDASENSATTVITVPGEL